MTQTPARNRRVALLSMHSCPIGRLGDGDVGGMNVYVANLGGELAKLGVVVDVFTRSDRAHGGETVDIAPSTRLAHIEAGSIDEGKRGLHRRVDAFARGVDNYRRRHALAYDLLHSHYWLSGMAAQRLSAAWRVPHVAMFHTTALTKMTAKTGEHEPQRRVEAERSILAQADAVIVSTAQERADLARLYGAAPDTIHTLPAGVDIDLFRPRNQADARRELMLPDIPIVLSVGRVEPLKGFDMLIKAVALLGGDAKATAVIVGGDPDTNAETRRLRALSKRLGVSDSVLFRPAEPQRRLSLYYNAADVFVLASRHESFGLVALEAMASGLPVVASSVSGPKSFIQEGRTGYLIEERRAETFAERIAALLRNPALRDAMGGDARAQAERMGWRRVAESTLDVYASLAAAAPIAPGS